MSVSVHDEAPAAPRSTAVPGAGDAVVHAPAVRSGIGSTDLLLASMALIWSINFSVIKYGTRFVEPLAYNGARIVLGAGAALFVLALWRRRERIVTPFRMRLILLGMLGNGLYQYFFIEGLARTRVATTVLLMASTPAAIALLGRVRGVERIALRGWLGIALQLSGVAVLLIGTGAADTGADSMAGALLVLAAVACWAVYAVALKPVSAHASWVEVTAYTLAGGAIVSAVLGASAIARASWETAPWALWPAIAYSGIMALLVATAFWYIGLKRLGPTRTAMYSNLQPLFAMAIAWAALGEVPTQWQSIGALLIMSGLLLARA
jgi:drug/metabolite transporter (DMT)-like permease